jgi:magnesium transporter
MGAPFRGHRMENFAGDQTMMLSCAVYETNGEPARPSALVDAFEASRDSDVFAWIALSQPTATEFAEVHDELHLHPLAIEDALRAHQRPKLDVFDSSLFLVAKSANYDDTNETISLHEIHAFVGDGSVVTVYHDGNQAEPDHKQMVDSMTREPELTACGPLSVLYRLLDQIVDGYQDVVDGVENDIDELEAQVFAGGRQNHAERIFRLKRQVLEFQRAVLALEEVLDGLVRQQLPPLFRTEALGMYFRDVQDHALRIVGRIETARDLLESALDANLAQIGVRQNEDMRAMAGWAAIVAVPTLFAGIWGMNFKHMPELNWFLGYPVALGTIFGSGFAVRHRLRKNGWL